MILPSRLFRTRWYIGCFVLSNILIASHLLGLHRFSVPFLSSNGADIGAGNATLGFQSIIAVAPREAPSWLVWRKEGLVKAAAGTGLDIEIPLQPAFSDADVKALTAKNKDLKRGYALSLLGHLHALREAATRTTALILEDDADWDVEIRRQMQQLAPAIRVLTRYVDRAHEANQITLPYGMNWDVLWLGHCGESMRNDGNEVRIYDPTIPPVVNSWESMISPDANHTRWVYYSGGPVCTYAYAVTGSAAKKLLERDDHGSENFDIWLHILCKGRKIRCVTVNPELFHHHEMAGQKYSLSNGKMAETIETEMTDNIWHSARCNSNVNSDTLVSCMGRKKPEPGKV